MSRSLFGRTVLKLVFLFFMIAIVTTVHSAWKLKTLLHEEFESKGTAISNSIASAAQESIISKDASMMQSLVDQYLDIRGVGYVFVADPEGEIIVHTFVPSIPKEIHALGRATPGIRAIEIEGAGVYTDVSKSVLSGIAGSVHVGMDQQIIEGHIRSAILTEVELLAAIFLISTFAAYLLARSITRPLQAAARVAENVASGDLTGQIEVKTEDETGQLLHSIQTMTGSLNSVVGQVQRSGIEIISTATRIAATSKDQETALQDFRKWTNEIVASAKQISATAQQLANTMADVMRVAQETRSLADSGKKSLAGMESTMTELTEATILISTILSEIQKKAQGIGAVITVITKVADQTNLLSLNASIEAHKAGPHGLGFRIVSGEIRRLADQTAVATLDIEKMVTELQSSSGEGVTRAEKLASGVRGGVQEIKRAGLQIGQILERVETLTPRFEAVTEGTVSQAAGAQQIRDSMVEFSHVVTKTAESVVQFHQITEQLYEAARHLQKEVSRFKVQSPSL